MILNTFVINIYSYREDAESAISKIKEVGKRSVQISFADKKPSRKERKKKEKEKPSGEI